jgi:protein phosphatase
MKNALVTVCGQATHKGLKRADNQDACDFFPKEGGALSTPKGQLFIVADGMGGHAGGKEASRMAVDLVLQAYFSDPDHSISDSLRRALEMTNEQIYQRANTSEVFRGMGTTCTVLVLRDDRACIAHVGDSRAYRITRSQIEQLTKDHSKVAEMRRLGILTEAEARHHPEKSHLYRALGIAAAVKADITPGLPLRGGERFLLCTDGIAKIEVEEIKKIVLSKSPQAACDALIQLANNRGGADNSTVQVIWIKPANSARERIYEAFSRFLKSNPI